MNPARPDPAPTRWWGWGDPAKEMALSDAALRTLAERTGEVTPEPRVELDEVGLPDAQAVPELEAAIGAEAVLDGREHRIRRSGGHSYPDLIRRRRGALGEAPDAVVMPASAAEVERALAACAEAGIAVVPFGGGTSVVGGVAPARGRFERVIALDLRRLRAASVDRRSLTASLGPGLRGPEAEALLGADGLTLGHFPQSFEYATIGGFAATRSAGQASSGYGRFDDLVTAIELTTPAGVLRTLATPHTAAGPALREVALGSEGTLGVITDVTARVRPAPAEQRYEAWITADFATGTEILRTLAQAGQLPDVARLSDEAETEASLAFGGAEGPRRRLLDAYLALRRRRGGCLVIAGWEGTGDDVARRRALSARLLRRGGATALGTAPGRAWLRGRYEGPYLREALLDHGYLAETLETSHTWSRLEELYRGVGSAISTALEGQGTPGIVMCHVSHIYRDGASLYFTVVARARGGEEIEQWRAVKSAACDAIVASGGTITHHHAVGRDHTPYMESEVGEAGLEALRALKERLDPAGIMNPEKLLP